MRTASEFNTMFTHHFEELGKFVEVDGGLLKTRALDTFFDFLTDNKDCMLLYRPDLKSVMEVRLMMLIGSGYHYRAYHYLRTLCDIEFREYYDENTDQCVEYFYNSQGELHYCFNT